MRLETLPVILGILFALAGLTLVADAAIPDGALLRPERRRASRPKRHLAGEGALGVGILSVGVGLIAGDGWRYTTVAFLLALILCTVGVVLNWRYVRGMMLVGTGDQPATTGRDKPARDVPGRDAPVPATATAADAPPATAPGAPPARPRGGPPADGGQRPEPRVHAR